MYYKIKVASPSRLIDLTTTTMWMKWERETERKLLYQQWCSVNLLIGVMCVTVPCTRSHMLYARHYNSITVTVKYLWDHRRRSVCCVYRLWLRNWNWNDSHDLASGVFAILKMEILVGKKVWRVVKKIYYSRALRAQQWWLTWY